MEKTEAVIYGPRVLDLLTRARRTLGEKYGVEVKRPTIVEIFTQQKDFGVRTFGMPENPGYLGVCFGRVVTANSPATNSHPVNWEAVLWHEFCHTVTNSRHHFHGSEIKWPLAPNVQGMGFQAFFLIPFVNFPVANDGGFSPAGNGLHIVGVVFMGMTMDLKSL